MNLHAANDHRPRPVLTADERLRKAAPMQPERYTRHLMQEAALEMQEMRRQLRLLDQENVAYRAALQGQDDAAPFAIGYMLGVVTVAIITAAIGIFF